VTSRARTLLCALAAALAVAAAGCGGDDEIPEREKIPPDITQELRRQIESIGQRVAAGVSGACDDIYDEGDGNIAPINAALESLPPRVDPRIRAALEQSVQNLEQLVDEECDAIRRSETGEETTPTETVETTTTETETVPTTETTPTETETVTTTPTDPTTPTDSPGGGQQGGGTDGSQPGRGQQGPSENVPPTGEGGGAEAPGGGQ